MVEYTHDIFLTRAEVVRRRSMSFIKEYAQKLVTAEEAVKEENLIFLGLIAMMDPPRPEAIQAVAYAKRAGIRQQIDKKQMHRCKRNRKSCK